jgi:hypothetical protein
MKAMKILCVAIPILMIGQACQEMEDFYLSGSVYIEDSYYPGLPIYSEWGYNTFGAYIDREPFVSTNNGLPAKVIVNSDTVHMILRGRMGSNDVDLIFSFKGFSPQTYYDLTGMDGTTIDLKESGRSVVLKIDDVSYDLDLIEGELHINRVQRLFVDEDLTRSIMSGYFQLKTFMHDEPIAITQGRFDLGIGYENFYNY